MSADEKWMRRALELAARGRGRTSPNPMVGAVLVKGTRRLGEGWHRKAGEAHAEVTALKKAKAAGGATLYVTLEPCSTRGRTPACTGAILKSGVRRVVVGAIDPNPRHSGRGLAILRKAGIQVRAGVLAEEISKLNRVFNYWISTGMPWITAKAAMTLDGKMATRTGESKWITSRQSRKVAHQLRAAADAILVGVNTVIADNPRLTVRGTERHRPLLRIVLDPSGRTPPASKVLRVNARYPTLVVTGPGVSAARRRGLAQHGAQIWRLPLSRGRFPLRQLLRKFGGAEITSVLVEGGSETLGAFFDAGLVRQAAFFYAPKLLGGDAMKAVGGRGVRRMKNAQRFNDLEVRRIGNDLLISAYV
jgi:diaminohydroxyphosphoribosylaminopyrimidine deaminase / 5-amino-6-(5-phosphoribosylamino)uracil reductase